MRRPLNRLIRFLISGLQGKVVYWEILKKLNAIDKNEYYDGLTGLVCAKVLKDDSTCVDIGAHSGTILDVMMQYAKNGVFYAFEPLPDFYKLLVKKYNDVKNVRIFQLALSNERGACEFNYVRTNPGYSGLIKRKYDRADEKDTLISVRTDLLDNIVQDCKVDFIKLDVEGAELQVILGAKTTIMNNQPVIIFEHGLGGSDCYGTTPEAVFDFLCADSGINLGLLNHFLKGKKALTRMQFCEEFYNRRNHYFVAYAHNSF